MRVRRQAGNASRAQRSGKQAVRGSGTITRANAPVSIGQKVQSMPILQCSAASVGSEPGFGFSAKGLSNVFTITTSSGVQSSQDVFASVPINPTEVWAPTTTDGLASAGGAITGTVAKNILTNFERFYPKRVRARWIPTLPTSASGNVALAFVATPSVAQTTSGPDPTSIATLLDLPVSKMVSVWEPMELSWNPGKYPERMIETYSTVFVGPQSLLAPGTLIVGFSGVASGAGSTVNAGRVEVQIDYAAYEPSANALQT